MVPDGEQNSPTEGSKVKRNRPYQTGLRGLIVLVACCAVILWAGRVMWLYRDPDLAAERAIEAGAFRTLESRKATGRVAAIQDLGRLSFADNPTAIRSLSALLRDENADVRVAAASALAEFGVRAVEAGAGGEAVKQAVKALCGSLKDPQPRVRVAAAITLGSISAARPVGDPGSAAGVPQPGPTAAAPVPVATVASPIDTRTVIAALSEVLGDPEASVRAAAVCALVTAGSMVDPPPALTAGLKDESPENRILTIRTLCNCRRGLDSWIPALLQIAEHDRDQSVRAACVYELDRTIKPRALTPRCVPDLIAGLGSRDRKVKIAVARLLERVSEDAEEAIPALLSILTTPIDYKEPDPGFERNTLASAVGYALGRIVPGTASTKDVVNRLIEVLRSGDDINRDQAFWILGKCGPSAQAAIPTLILALKEAGSARGVDCDLGAARALGDIAPDTPKADDVVTALLPVLKSESPRSRAAAALALLRFGPKAAIAIPGIRALTNDRDVFVKQAAERALLVLLDDSNPEPHE